MSLGIAAGRRTYPRHASGRISCVPDALSELGQSVGFGPLQACIAHTSAEALARYHLSPENKFTNAVSDSGETRRRHVAAGRVELIGERGDCGR